MSGAAFLRIKKLKGGGIITVAARHNRRTIQAEIGASLSIDPTRSHLNETLVGAATAEDVGQCAKNLMAAAGITKLRKDAVLALEIVFSLPPAHQLDAHAYFSDCSAWAEQYFACPLLTVDIHHDEANDHCHILLLPLVDGRMVGSDMFGGKKKLMALQQDFHDKVAGLYGLRKAPARLSCVAKQSASKAVLQRLRETGDKALQSQVWATLRNVIERDPAPFLLALGMDLPAPTKKLKTFTQIMTSKGKGGNKETNPIGFTPPPKKQTLSCVGFAPKSPPLPATTAPPSKPFSEINVADLDDTPFMEQATRHRDCDQPSDRYDLTSGDYCDRPLPAPRQHKQACDAALTALRRHQVRQDFSFSVVTNL